MEIGRKIYYELLTGNVLVDTGERDGNVIPSSREHDIEIFKELSIRNPNTFDVIHLEYGQYREDFDICIGKRVDLATKQLQFSYPDPNQPEEPTPYQAPLSERVEDLTMTVDSILTDLLPTLMG